MSRDSDHIDQLVHAFNQGRQTHTVWLNTEEIIAVYGLTRATIHNKAHAASWRRRTHPTNHRRRQYHADDVARTMTRSGVSLENPGHL